MNDTLSHGLFLKRYTLLPANSGNYNMIGDDWIKLDCNELCEEFGRWLLEATKTGYWSEQNQKGKIICWKSFWDASKHESKASEFNQPGCYLLGVGYDDVRIRYVGQTKNTIKGRLGNRYISSKKPNDFDDVRIEQFHLAAWLADHNNDWRRLPDHIIRKHFKAHKKSSRPDNIAHIRKNADPTTRIKHATDFAKHIAKYGKNGSDNMWFALIPMTSSERTKTLECYLLATLIRWNEKNSHSRLLNDVY